MPFRVGNALVLSGRQSFILSAGLVVSGCLVVAVAGPTMPAGRIERFLIGVLVGTMFGHAVLAAAWTALGPLSLKTRLPLAITWLIALSLALAFNIAFWGGPDDVVPIMAVCTVSVWLAVLAPLGVIARVYRLAIHDRDLAAEERLAKPLQFGIRQVMVLTAAVGVLLGIGRLVLPVLAKQFSDLGGDVPIFTFLAVAGVAMSLPLALATMLPRGALVATLVALALIVGMTWWELPLLNRLVSRGGGPNMDHILSINGVQTLWVLLLTGALRLGGFRLAPATFTPRPAPPHSASVLQRAR